MPNNSEIILSNQTHPGDSSIQTATSDAYKGDGYYGRSDGFHTVQYNLAGDNDGDTFSGRVIMQGTLAVDPVESDWFDIDDTLEVFSEASGSFIYNFTGNYVWVRADIGLWTDGTINSIVLNH